MALFDTRPFVILNFGQLRSPRFFGYRLQDLLTAVELTGEHIF
ncbi:Uncharacterised protein [Mycobacteroides abscessus subsp. abscessus]|nr:Uncharacterised protein [Mycobacteroides abscessus subsp. abscessus]